MFNHITQILYYTYRPTSTWATVPHINGILLYNEYYICIIYTYITV